MLIVQLIELKTLLNELKTDNNNNKNKITKK